jgi:hypothetical protein
MHFFGAIGIVTLALGMIINLYLLGLKIFGYDIWGKPILILGMLLVMGGIQFITIGIMSEILMRTYYEGQNKKPYRVRKISVTKKN